MFSSVIMAMVSGMIILLFLVSSWIISHLGVNPESGGSPPKDSKVVISIMVIAGVLFHIRVRDDIEVVRVFARIIKMDSVSKM